MTSGDSDTHQRAPWGVVRLWLLMCLLVEFFFAMMLFSTAFTRGLGLVRVGDHFILFQGYSVADISDQLGWAIWVLERLTIAAFAGYFGLAPAVFLKRDTINPIELANSEEGRGFLVPLALGALLVLFGAIFFAGGCGTAQGIHSIR